MYFVLLSIVLFMFLIDNDIFFLIFTILDRLKSLD